jgi:hypothetical protein
MNAVVSGFSRFVTSKVGGRAAVSPSREARRAEMRQYLIANRVPQEKYDAIVAASSDQPEVAGMLGGSPGPEALDEKTSVTTRTREFA